jgi:hypothetical protein
LKLHQNILIKYIARENNMDDDIFALINEECELNDEWEKERENDRN